jgi:3-oxoacyl-[acyl-carrier-protein] synthase II
VPNVPRDLPDLSVAVSNSFGFGGHNASIVLRRWDE